MNIDDLRATVNAVYFIAFTKVTDKDTRARMVIDGNNLQDALTELDSLRSQMRTEGWIPVGERLPKPGVTVVVYYGKCLSVGFHNGKIWWEVITNSKVDVSHWMPLPEPPRKDDGDTP